MKINKILAIAISEYADSKLSDLKNCYTDLSEIITLLSNKYKFDEVEFIYKKEETTRKKINLRLNEYFKNCLEEDRILILFAGHGEYDKYTGISYWQPSDADSEDTTSWINVEAILRLFKVCQAKQISVISDTCFSGAIFEDLSRGGGIDVLANKNRGRL